MGKISILLTVAILTCLSSVTLSEPQDFVNPNYVIPSIDKSNTRTGKLTSAQNYIISRAHSSAKGTPVSITDKSVYPPSNNKADYLSWAPYYWPDCNYCSGTKHAKRDDYHPRSNNKKGQGQEKNCRSTAVEPPSATYTTCNYYPRDGKQNPDVRNLNDTRYISTTTQSLFFNTLAFAFTQKEHYLHIAKDQIRTFFIKQNTAMNPAVPYGQTIRGPPKQNNEGSQEQFMALLDMRGLVKLVNSVLILKRIEKAWSAEDDKGLQKWSDAYTNWALNSRIGKKAINSYNNHGSHMTAQLAALYILQDQPDAAKKILSTFFSRAFKDQISSNGEQPLEASRTRPYHYRNFNLEALITNAKLGDYLGMDFWTATSANGATIQTALDYIMTLDPGSEDVSEIYPHVSAIAVAYGDPTKKYAKFLEHTDASSRPFSYYNQPAAFKQSPSSKNFAANVDKNKQRAEGAGSRLPLALRQLEDKADHIDILKAEKDDQSDKASDEINDVEEGEEQLRHQANELDQSQNGEEYNQLKHDSYDDDDSASYDPYGDDDYDPDIPEEPTDLSSQRTTGNMRRPDAFKDTDYVQLEDQMYASWAVLARWYQPKPPADERPFPQPVYLYQLDQKTQERLLAKG